MNASCTQGLKSRPQMEMRRGRPSLVLIKQLAMPQALLLLVVFYTALLATGASTLPPEPPRVPSRPPPERSNCRDKCGDVDIPYPFGIGCNCSLPNFGVRCDETTSPPSLHTGNVRIGSISLEKAQMVVYTFLTCTCSMPNGSQTVHWGQDMAFNVTGSPFLLSPASNMFTTVGCSSEAKLHGHSGAKYLTGCITTCTNVSDTGDDGTSCSGQGCCEASLTPGLREVSVKWSLEEGNNPVPDNPCQYAFVAQKGWYNFSRKDVIGNMTFAKKLGEGPVVPLVLDWAIRDGMCPPAAENGSMATVPYCVSTHSYCVNASHGEQGYFCNCSKGYAGNPYITDGCTNIDECELRRSNSTKYEEMYPCRGGTCHDEDGDYLCKCNFGRRGDGKIGKGCEPILSTAAVAVIGTISGISILAVLLIFLHMEHEKRKLRDRFNRNGGELLKSIKIEIFTKEQLDKITKNYSHVIGRGAFGEVYKGTTSNNVQVAVKRCIAVDKDRQKDFVNEMTIQSKISHSNLVRLLGCCLETEVPMLVYEFVPRGSLYDVLHGKNGNGRRQPLSLGECMDIAINSAEALAYMHCGQPGGQKILHGDVKSGNILLDDNFVPKVSDFGTSRLLSMDKDHTNMVIGDSSYIDPVYMMTGLLTEKSDVYSFGIVILELITGKKARYDGNNSLPLNYLKASMDGTTKQMHDKEVDIDCREEVGLIAVKCLEAKVDDRPTMTEVAEKLKVYKWMQSHGEQTNEICT